MTIKSEFIEIELLLNYKNSLKVKFLHLISVIKCIN